MIIEKQQTLMYIITLTEDELDCLVTVLGIAKSDWNLTGEGKEIYDKLRSVKEI